MRITQSRIKELYLLISTNTTLFHLLVPNTLDRQIIEMYWQKDINFQNIASILNLSDSSVLARYKACLRKLRTRIHKLTDAYIHMLSSADSANISNFFVLSQIKLLRSEENSFVGCESVSEENTRKIFLSSCFEKKTLGRYVNILNKRKIYTLGDLCLYTKKEIKLIPGIGVFVVDVLEKELNNHKMNFKS